MDADLERFLLKFAELERRTRKLLAEDRALRQEVEGLRRRLEQAEAESEAAKKALERERLIKKKARERLARLIEGLENMKELRAEALSNAAAGRENDE